MALASCPSSHHHLKKTLRSLPRSLDETYSRMLSNINPELIDNVKRILAWLCFSLRPVTVQEIIEGLMVELGENPRLNKDRQLQDPNDVIAICPGLISMSSREDEPSLSLRDVSLISNQDSKAPLIRIAHFSVQEYLESDRIQSQTGAKFALHSRTANTELARTCITYLQNLRLPDLDGFPLASYAAEYWYQHFLNGDETSESLNSLAVDFLSSEGDVFENSIRIFNPDIYVCPRKDLGKLSEDIASPLYYASCWDYIDNFKHYWRLIP
jgi:ankyrin repeat domain-containing protein 50